ncbi:hypothetical protein SPRG_18747 [Saprolegnia parasitica CBS 223.65]|uniref:Uncharacterized protein n=1 Tax=Saprolegnia parasitica (strain CBS 223.65) TaxID=695850 RepID=A0A067BCB8_SAPPC|nr:hypothetical protein SPRG_18747 [Saprolegnia parasitica CBS 223.65]KDO15713.1 hypothetical protein SPRG_18747 [Saprolegnia parasitica CBS 223.65]|eukprot:XP_012213579.1 hypothetical protein SPRG_18747 [Saprolegnia parasitica CBS 223.65]
MDCFDVLVPDRQLLVELDSSSGHNKCLPDALKASIMSKGWGGAQPKMHPTVLTQKCLGPYPCSYQAGDIQSMVFLDTDAPPVASPTASKCDEERDVMKPKRRASAAKRQHVVGSKRTKEQYKTHCAPIEPSEHKGAVTDVPEVTRRLVEGYVGKAKGLHQVHFETDWILATDKSTKPELETILAARQDFVNEPTLSGKAIILASLASDVLSVDRVRQYDFLSVDEAMANGTPSEACSQAAIDAQAQDAPLDP